METLDWIITAVIALGAAVGFAKGFIRQLASIGGLIAGLLLARALFRSVGERLAAETGASVTFSQILAFIIIWLIVPISLSLLAEMLTRAADAVQMGCANRWLGAVLGSVKYAVLLSMAVCFIEFIDTENDLIPSTKKRESALYYPVKSLSGILIPAIKDFTKRLTDTDYARI